MSTFTDKHNMKTRRDGIDMKITCEDHVTISLVLSNEAIWQLMEFIVEEAPTQYDIVKRVIQEHPGVSQ